MAQNSNNCGNSIPTPEEDMIIYERCKVNGELKHGLFHLACAISSDPENEYWLKELDNLIKRSKDPLKLIDEEKDTYFAVAAVKAYIYASIENYDYALNLISQVIKVKPEIPYALWAIQWIDKARSEKKNGIFKLFHKKSDLEKVKVDTIISFIGSGVQGVHQLTEGLKIKVLNDFSRILNDLGEICSNNHLLFWVLSAVQRRQDQWDLAMKSAQRAYDIKKCWQTAVGVALVYKGQGDIEQAVEYYEEAGALDPKDASVYLDIGDTYLEISNYSEGAKEYKKAINIDSNNSWAIPSLYFCEFMMNKDKEYIEKLITYSKENPENERAKYLLYLIDNMETGEAYADYIPEPAEATINVLKQIVEEIKKLKPKENDDEAKSNSIDLTISNIEAPSSVLAFELSMKTYYNGTNLPKLNLKVESIPEPDPRRAIKEVFPLLWDFDGTEPKSIYKLPSKEIVDAVNALALEEYNVESWYEKAEAFANKFTISSVEEFFSVMINPTVPPEKFTPWNWIQRTQYAAVFILAHIEKQWIMDAKKNPLLSICYGPLDWPVNATITVLTHMANKRTDIQTDVVNIFLDLVKRIPKEGYCFFEHALINNMLKLSCVEGEFKEELLQWKKNFEQ